MLIPNATRNESPAAESPRAEPGRRRDGHRSIAVLAGLLSVLLLLLGGGGLYAYLAPHPIALGPYQLLGPHCNELVLVATGSSSTVFWTRSATLPPVPALNPGTPAAPLIVRNYQAATTLPALPATAPSTAAAPGSTAALVVDFTSGAEVPDRILWEGGGFTLLGP